MHGSTRTSPRLMRLRQAGPRSRSQIRCRNRHKPKSDRSGRRDRSVTVRPPANGCRNAGNSAALVAYDFLPTAKREAGARSSSLSTNPSPNPCWREGCTSGWRDRDAAMKVLWPLMAATKQRAGATKAGAVPLSRTTCSCRWSRSWCGRTKRNLLFFDLNKVRGSKSIR